MIPVKKKVGVLEGDFKGGGKHDPLFISLTEAIQLLPFMTGKELNWIILYCRFTQVFL